MSIEIVITMVETVFETISIFIHFLFFTIVVIINLFILVVLGCRGILLSSRVDIGSTSSVFAQLNVLLRVELRSGSVILRGSRLVIVLHFNDESELVEVEASWQLWPPPHVFTLGLLGVVLLPLEILCLVEWEIVTDHIPQLLVGQYGQVFHSDLGEHVEKLLFVDEAIVVLVRPEKKLELLFTSRLRIFPLEEIKRLHKLVKVDNTNSLVVLGLLWHICIIWVR